MEDCITTNRGVCALDPAVLGVLNITAQNLPHLPLPLRTKCYDFAHTMYLCASYGAQRKHKPACFPERH
jgi:hypothetical protein